MLKLLFVSTELSPFAKVGGLADVAEGLPKALLTKGIDIRVAIPGYKRISLKTEYLTDFPVMMGDRKEAAIIKQVRVPFGSENKSLQVYLIGNYHYFDRDGIYSYYDDGERFAFFCRAALDMLPAIDFKPDIVHVNDWPTGPICMLLKEKYRFGCFFKDIKTIYSIHNLEHQGRYSPDMLRFFEMGREVFTADKTEFYGMFNYLKAGVAFADKITTVSETYSNEIQGQILGEGLEGIFQKRKKDLFGIVNGINYEEYDPATDNKIYKNYSASNISDKKENKYSLQKEMGLLKSDAPLISIVSRLYNQKGLSLVIDKIHEIMKKDIQFIVLGSGEPYYEWAFNSIQQQYPEKFAVYIGYNSTLAQKIYAGSDMFLMPSRYEPCGLGQILSLRYGTIPVVRATGGLKDTIIDIDSDLENGNGFSFEEYSSCAMMNALERAILTYHKKKDIWENLIKRAMTLDLSWNNPAKKYEEVYLKCKE